MSTILERRLRTYLGEVVVGNGHPWIFATIKTDEL